MHCVGENGKSLVEHPDVDLVSFTGSSETRAFVASYLRAHSQTRVSEDGW
ncbi:aldehyde dehydrogenase family protein [Scytonema sp. UIC 10036]